ncbi:MAG: acyl-CoA dehydrogenase [Desulfobacterales bacterium]|nr:acyl-CoA dehydrogenase [Desulfobacterales bacterium]MCP4162167.1 acyl-CoA dehydrogenase [Deltaproteobacteria bacterium]
MEILEYTDEHKEFRNRLREFAIKEIIPLADEWEENHLIPKEIWQKMGKAGFLCTNVPSEYGGHGLDFLYSVIIIEELSRTNQSGLVVSLHSDIVVPYITSYGSEEIKKKYIPGTVTGDTITAVAMTEPDAGSDLVSMKTTAIHDGDSVVINGSKTFISNGINCGLVVVAACDPEEPDPYRSISLYIVEEGTPGFEKGKKLDKMGMHSQDTSELFFNNCKIPKENLLGDKGGGFIMLMEKLQQERLVCAIGAVAGAQYILENTIDYCKNTLSGSGKPLSKSQATRFAIVEMSTEVKLGKTFVDKLIAEHMNGENVVIETSMSKYWTTEMIKRTVDRCLDLTEDYGISEECLLGRAMRDVRVHSIFAGTNEIMKEICSKFMGL